MSFQIYLVEDDHNLNLVLTSYLQKEGWRVSSFSTGEAARQAIEQPPDLWVLDIMLPDIDGYQLIREIKAKNLQTPVIFISARDADIDRVVGLELGSDDYLPKPFLPRELVIRTRKLLERIHSSSTSVQIIPPYNIDEASRSAKLGDTMIDLTSKEFDLLILFIKNQGLAFSREQILINIWGDNYFGSDRVVDDLIRRLRKKMPSLSIETMYGYGYRMVKS
ncbi:transcriptional regulatory protein CssR [Clostridium aceticum]|uniref:Stage 0 sporulation protein A homolog n=1 Tax=Clostridium aceticum TaxID=84022 RepID=A0A0D8IH16_9CLOT|nr:response regulator transcription factor [Clostridium aceticum]AKL94206.1 transcriptional regulatory protein CssR [Clostridium aceticum]KJF28456.1 transcriptional regulator [Clostridium aceticum]